MLQDAGAERQRLTELYGQKWDGELLELAADAGDLTEMAQQVLRDEMRKRGLGVPVPGQPVMQRAVEPGIEEPEFGGEIFRAPATQGEDEGGDTEPAHEYTWKTERAARQQGSSSSGRIVPTEAKPSELSGCIVGRGKGVSRRNREEISAYIQ
jgi:hypothetical protein